MFGRFFKAISAVNYSLIDNEVLSYDILLDGVKQLEHKSIRPNQRECVGFSSIVGYHDSTLLIQKVSRFILLSVTHEHKKINKLKIERLVAVKKRELAEKNNINVEDIPEQEIDDLREQIKRDELQKISPQEDQCNIIIDPELSRIYFSTIYSSPICKKAVGLLQKCAPNLKVHPFIPATVETILTQWVYQPANALPEDIELGQEVALRSEEEAKAKLQKQDLASVEVTTMIDHGKQVHEVAVVYQARMAFVLTSQCYLKKVKPLDLYYDAIERDSESISYLEDYNPDWIMLCEWVTDFFTWMLEKFEVPAN